MDRIFNNLFSPLFNIFRNFGSLLINNKYFSFSKIYTKNTLFINGIIVTLLTISFYFTGLTIYYFSFCTEDVINLSSAILISNTHSINIKKSEDKSKKQIKYKYNYIKITVSFKDFTENKFIQILMLNLKLHSLNTILFQYNEYNTSTQLMLGPQVGIVVKDIHNINYYRKLYEYYVDKLEIQMSFYTVGLPDFITIYLKEIQVEDEIKIGDLSRIELPNKIIKVSDTKTKFNSNILPLTPDEKYFGSLLEGNLKLDYLNKLITNLENNKLLVNLSEYNKSTITNFNEDITNIVDQFKYEEKQITFLKNVKNLDKYKVYLSKNKLYLIISYLIKNFEYNRIVFKINTGK